MEEIGLLSIFCNHAGLRLGAAEILDGLSAVQKADPY